MKTAVIAVYAILLGAPALCAGAGEAISREQALETALNKVTGISVKSSELEKEEGKEVWSFDLQTPAGIREIWVDARTGAVVRDEMESAADEKAEAAKDEAAKNEPAKAAQAAPAPGKAVPPATAKAVTPGNAPQKKPEKAVEGNGKPEEKESAGTEEKEED